MKKLITFILLVVSASALAVQVEFVGPCSEKPLYSVKTQATKAKDVGTLTVEVLDKAQIQYQGVPQGFNQIFNSPLGLDALEILSDEEMLSYGWCFEVDGKVTEDYADQISLKGVKKIQWFFGYAHYVRGEWKSFCQKAYLRRSEFLCGK